MLSVLLAASFQCLTESTTVEPDCLILLAFRLLNLAVHRITKLHAVMGTVILYHQPCGPGNFARSLTSTETAIKFGQQLTPNLLI